MSRILFLSGHDFRSPRKANIHFIAKAATQSFARVDFISLGFSNISLLKNDTRTSLSKSSNKWEVHEGVHSFLWKTFVHPFNPSNKLTRGAIEPLYHLYSLMPNKTLDDAIANADVIVFESGLSPILIERVRKINSNARLIYVASDLLSTIGVHPRVIKAMDEGMQHFSVIRIAARDMRDAFAAAADQVRFIPHGIDKSIANRQMENPYDGGLNIVSVGSMLFDPSFFTIAASAFPDVKFHVIGAKGHFDLPPNVKQYPETPFARTLPFIKFADAGVAPYRPHSDAGYLADSSMKLTQYGFLKLPAICPTFAAGDYPGRYGYEPGDRGSIVSAIHAATSARGQFTPRDVLSWEEVTLRLLAA